MGGDSRMEKTFKFNSKSSFSGTLSHLPGELPLHTVMIPCVFFCCYLCCLKGSSCGKFGKNCWTSPFGFVLQECNFIPYMSYVCICLVCKCAGYRKGKALDLFPECSSLRCMSSGQTYNSKTT